MTVESDRTLLARAAVAVSVIQGFCRLARERDESGKAGTVLVLPDNGRSRYLGYNGGSVFIVPNENTRLPDGKYLFPRK